ncbi:cation:proton antiporter domain-containing protein [Kovacikia minuta]|uniref:cation:proton antiporter domain-containing protein n=1 Tax=Kovacikia minuta TaxID=2931930 RepID=UPI0026760F1D
MDAPLDMTLQMILTVIAGIGAQVLAEFLKLPGIVFLLLFGILLGPSVTGLLQPDRLGIGLDVIVSLLVAVILFEGGFNLELRDLGRVSGSLRNLVTLGTLITLLGGGMAAHWLTEFPWAIAFLYASLVVVTGPTVINPLLKQVKVDRQIATLLEGEGVLIGSRWGNPGGCRPQHSVKRRCRTADGCQWLDNSPGHWSGHWD